ncbi:helix-turn-helix transcriptional regulator [Novosphingobium fuchskuhlense]|nr:WYL domain-containing protein [Novosphingobium fuchskuhlense]
MPKLDRLLTLAHALVEHNEGLSLNEMAALLRVNRRTAERMRDVIAAHFDLEVLQDGRNRSWRIAGKLGRMFTKPNAVELATLAEEVSALRASRQDARADVLAGLQAKVQSALDLAARTRIAPDIEALNIAQRMFVPAGPCIPVAGEVFAVIQNAIMAGVMVEFKYQADGKPKPEWRRVTPYGLVQGPLSYLIAKVPGEHMQPVNYRLDRMSEIALSDRIAENISGFDLDEWMSRSFGIWQGEIYPVSLKVLTHAAERARHWRFHRNQMVEEMADGSLRIQFAAGGMRELAQHLCMWAGDIVIEGPAELRSDYVGIADAVLASAHLSSG